jgi:transcription-repair coupling factor (superfamily II helicase)
LTTATSLTLRGLLKGAITRSGMATSARVVTGLTPAAKALYVAAAAQGLPRGVVWYVVPTDADIEQGVGDVALFLSAMEGLASDAADRAVMAFPSHEIDPYRGLAPHVGVTSLRARALCGVGTSTARVVVASAAALLPAISAPRRLLGAALHLEPGQEIAPTDLAALLIDAGFTREDPADEHGQFAVRGGIVDIFPAGEPQPVRLEFIGDTIESIRRYDPATQRSIEAIDRMVVVPLQDVLTSTLDGGHARPATDARGDAREVSQSMRSLDRSASVLDYMRLASDHRILVSERDDVDAEALELVEQIQQSYEDHRTRQPGQPPPAALFVDWPTLAAHLDQGTRLAELGLTDETPDAAALAEGDSEVAPDHLVESGSGRTVLGTLEVRCQPAVAMHGRLADWVAEIKIRRAAGETTLFIAATAGRAERTIELLKEYEVFAVPVDRAEDARYAAVLVATGTLSTGFRLPAADLQIYAETDIFEEERRAPERRRSATRAFLSDLRDLKVSDLVVHVEHGIGMFVGLKEIGVSGGAVQEFLELRYAGEDKLFVPVERLDLVQKYTGASRPPLDRLGGTSWERAKSRVKKAMRDMAEELLKLYAARKAVPGYAFSPDSHWQQEFEGAFAYELTVDQRTAVADIKHDMESPTPMDRLLCGDVGYGKTEVAMRAAFKAVMDGKQVAVLAPTTVLAFQHQKTLRERFAGFPVRVEMVSRFRTKAQQAEALIDLEAGKVDIIVGTHRLLSKDVAFRDLGLLVVDEEQRFGVAHKEKIKHLRKRVDVLTMTATPIPRTLNMSLVGIRDMSIIETPPKDRLSIQTHVVKFDPQVMARAIRSEIARGGQVYVVHNRVESIFSIGALIQRLVPEARVVVGHGQMGEDALERAMLDFVERRFDVLLATTIVENGLDIPNANTIIINRADRYGLSQLYQLRGRVGRSDRPAYAYLLIPPEDNLSPVAKKRLAAIKEFSDLGSGFRVAALDLEIRGAGNLLGGEQSGHIETLGFEMYMKLLEETVRELKGEELEDDVRATVNLRVDLRIDADYVPDMNQRLMLYRKVAAARREEDIDRVLEEAADRYGPWPDSVLNLADYGRIRVMADRLDIDTIDREGQTVVIKFRPQAKIDPARLVSLVRQRAADITLVPPGALKLSLAAAPARRPTADQVSSNRQESRSRSGPAGAGQRQGSSKYAGAAPSWWTARAKATEVTPGFSKSEMLKTTEADPRGPEGAFARVGGLLSELLDQR